MPVRVQRDTVYRTRFDVGDVYLSGVNVSIADASTGFDAAGYECLVGVSAPERTLYIQCQCSTESQVVGLSAQRGAVPTPP